MGVVGGRVGEVGQRRVKAKGVKEGGQKAADLGFVGREAHMISHTLLTQKNTIGTQWNVYIKWENISQNTNFEADKHPDHHKI